MNDYFQLILKKATRIPSRLRENLRAISLLKNWREFLSAKHLGNNLRKIHLRNGIVLTAPPHTDLSFLFQEIWIDKIYSPAGYRISPNDNVIDIGANIGVFSLYAATVASETKVYAFEPFPENADYLRQNVNDSKITNIKIEEKAVARRANKRNLEITESGITHSLSENENPLDAVSVECTTLDEILEQIPRCDLLKIDCEGSEYEIIYACSPSNLKKIHRIVGEYHYRDDAKKNGKALKEYLESQLFTVDYFVAFDKYVGLICATNKN